MVRTRIRESPGSRRKAQVKRLENRQRGNSRPGVKARTKLEEGGISRELLAAGIQGIHATKEARQPHPPIRHECLHKRRGKNPGDATTTCMKVRKRREGGASKPVVMVVQSGESLRRGIPGKPRSKAFAFNRQTKAPQREPLGSARRALTAPEA